MSATPAPQPAPTQAQLEAVLQAALAELEVAQIGDFEHLLEAMDSLPVTVRRA